MLVFVAGREAPNPRVLLSLAACRSLPAVVRLPCPGQGRLPLGGLLLRCTPGWPRLSRCAPGNRASGRAPIGQGAACLGRPGRRPSLVLACCRAQGPRAEAAWAAPTVAVCHSPAYSQAPLRPACPRCKNKLPVFLHRTKQASPKSTQRNTAADTLIKSNQTLRGHKKKEASFPIEFQ